MMNQCPRYTLGFVRNAIKNYRQSTPSYNAVIKLIHDNGDCPKSGIQSDHVAFRSFSRNQGFQKIKSLLTYGNAYTPRDTFDFPQKHLKAQWFSPNFSGYPRIFLSEILNHELSENAQGIINKYIDYVPDVKTPNNASEIKSLVQKTLTRKAKPLKYTDYELLNTESNYAAWTLLHGPIINHETISVHNLSDCNGRNQIGPFMDHLVNQNVKGETDVKVLTEPKIIQESNDRLLLQSSSMSDIVTKIFEEGPRKVPGSFVEFIERKRLLLYNSLPESEIQEMHRRDGFEAGNAFFIFDSTKTTNKYH